MRPFRHAIEQFAKDHERIARNAVKAAETAARNDPRFSIPHSLTDLHEALSATHARLEPGEIAFGLYRPHADELE